VLTEFPLQAREQPTTAATPPPTPPPTGPFDVFLSHNSQDKPVVRQLAQSLTDRGLRVWLDEQELVPGRPWQEALEAAILAARSAAVIVGPSGLGPWKIRRCVPPSISS